MGLGYVISSALVLAILNSPRIAQEAHAVGDILFGNAVTVPHNQVLALIVAGCAALASHALFFKELLFVSYDPETASVQGVGTIRFEVLLNIAAAQSDLNENPAARRTLEELISKYPQSEAATKARQRLGQR